MADLISNISFIHTADWHLGSPKNWGSERLEGLWINRFNFYREEAIKQIIAGAVDNKVSAVLVAGDVLDAEYLDGPIAQRCETFLLNNVIKPLRKNNIKLIMTSGGTHDQKKWNKETNSTKLLS
jgi:DNA repair exonuclease SbcCD nuclease subunit